MTEIIRLQDNEMNKLPVNGRAYVCTKENDEVIAMAKFNARYGFLPEKVYRWKQYLYIPAPGKDVDKMIEECFGPESRPVVL